MVEQEFLKPNIDKEKQEELKREKELIKKRVTIIMAEVVWLILVHLFYIGL